MVHGVLVARDIPLCFRSCLHDLVNFICRISCLNSAVLMLLLLLLLMLLLNLRLLLLMCVIHLLVFHRRGS